METHRLNDTTLHSVGKFLITIQKLVQSKLEAFKTVLQSRFRVNVLHFEYLVYEETGNAFVEIDQESIETTIEALSVFIWDEKQWEVKVTEISEATFENQMCHCSINSHSIAIESKGFSSNGYRECQHNKYQSLNNVLGRLNNDFIQENKKYKDNISYYLNDMESFLLTKYNYNLFHFSIECSTTEKFLIVIPDTADKSNTGAAIALSVQHFCELEHFSSILKDIIISLDIFLQSIQFNQLRQYNKSGTFIQVAIRTASATDEAIIAIELNTTFLEVAEIDYFKMHLNGFYTLFRPANYVSLSIYFKANNYQEQISIVEHLYGMKKITDVICKIPFQIGPYSKFPFNIRVTSFIYNMIIQYILKNPDSIIIHISDGNSKMALCLAQSCKYIVCFDNNTASVKETELDILNNSFTNVILTPAEEFNFINDARIVAKVRSIYGLLKTTKLTILIDLTRMELDKNTILNMRKLFYFRRLIYISIGTTNIKKDLIRLCRPESIAYPGSPFNPKSVFIEDILPYTNQNALIVIFER